ncbi:hypothetical protein [Vibrio nigripulchritudo]|nr:hypothetical protein [Vibrio nigripulchritudo]
MSRVHFDKDIQPLSEFRAGVAVVLDFAEYEAMQEKIELLEEMRKAEAQIASCLGISNEDARVLGRIKK